MSETRKLRRGLCAALCCVAFAAPGWAQDVTVTLDAGEWQFASAFTVPALDVFNEESQTTCLTAPVTRSLAQMIAELGSSDISDCNLSNVRDSGSEATFDVTCETRFETGVITGQAEATYQYDRTGFSGSFAGSGTSQGQTFDLSGNSSGRRIGNC